MSSFYITLTLMLMLELELAMWELLLVLVLLPSLEIACTRAPAGDTDPIARPLMFTIMSAV
jgi:hypothetical protein